MTEPGWQRWFWTLGLAVLALIHLAPVAGVSGIEALQRLYGVEVAGSDLELLLRHRAVLFALVGGPMILAMFVPLYRWLALVAGWFNVASFLLLATQIGDLNPALIQVQQIDTWALIPLSGLSVAYVYRLWQRRAGRPRSFRA